MNLNEILHTILDVLAGRRNLPEHEADAIHEQIDPGYTAPKVSEAELEAARALVARQDQAAAYQASLAAQQAAPAPAPAPEPAPVASPFVPPVQ